MPWVQNLGWTGLQQGSQYPLSGLTMALWWNEIHLSANDTWMHRRAVDRSSLWIDGASKFSPWPTKPTILLLAKPELQAIMANTKIVGLVTMVAIQTPGHRYIVVAIACADNIVGVVFFCCFILMKQQKNTIMVQECNRNKRVLRIFIFQDFYITINQLMAIY